MRLLSLVVPLVVSVGCGGSKATASHLGACHTADTAYPCLLLRDGDDFSPLEQYVEGLTDTFVFGYFHTVDITTPDADDPEARFFEGTVPISQLERIEQGSEDEQTTGFSWSVAPWNVSRSGSDWTILGIEVDCESHGVCGELDSALSRNPSEDVFIVRLELGFPNPLGSGPTLTQVELL